jgi:hypothetical protein
VTATDPIIDGDGIWRPTTTSATGPTFTYGCKTWKAPAGSCRMNILREDVSAGGKATNGDTDGDVNRDGDNDIPMEPYKDGCQIGHFDTNDPATVTVTSSGVPGRCWPHRRRRRVEGGPGRARPPTTTR